jgi:hypothetical protein
MMYAGLVIDSDSGRKRRLSTRHFEVMAILLECDDTNLEATVRLMCLSRIEIQEEKCEEVDDCCGGLERRYKVLRLGYGASRASIDSRVR